MCDLWSNYVGFLDEDKQQLFDAVVLQFQPAVSVVRRWMLTASRVLGYVLDAFYLWHFIALVIFVALISGPDSNLLNVCGNAPYFLFSHHIGHFILCVIRIWPRLARASAMPGSCARMIYTRAFDVKTGSLVMLLAAFGLFHVIVDGREKCFSSIAWTYLSVLCLAVFGSLILLIFFILITNGYDRYAASIAERQPLVTRASDPQI